MGMTLKRILENINSLSNKNNSNIIINYHSFLLDKGSAINSQMLKVKQLLTDIIVEGPPDKDGKSLYQFAVHPYSNVITVNEINTSNFALSNSSEVTEQDQIKELSFRLIRESINIYETAKLLIFIRLRVLKIHLTNKKDVANNPILRYESSISFNILEKNTMGESSNINAETKNL